MEFYIQVLMDDDEIFLMRGDFVCLTGRGDLGKLNLSEAEGDAIMLIIEFTGQITATDEEISEAIFRAESVFAQMNRTPEEAAEDNFKSIAQTEMASELWSQADYAAKKNMGEGAQLVWN